MRKMSATAVLSDREILSELQSDGSVVITPFIREHLSNCSYDITLGVNYYTRNEDIKDLPYFCPWNPDHVARYWNKKSSTARTITTSAEATLMGVQVGDMIIVMQPGETILAHTNEFIGGRRNVTTMMKARSSLGRCCITICKDAGWGDIGYCNRYTMEIQNTGTVPTVLVSGQKVGQIVFFRTGLPFKSYSKDGAYQKVDAEDMSTIIKSWQPSDMLPKLKRIPLPEEEERKSTPTSSDSVESTMP